MKQYKKLSTIALLASLAITSSYASYSLVYPLSDIKFTNIPKIEETWSAGEPVVSQWIFGEKNVLLGHLVKAQNLLVLVINKQRTIVQRRKHVVFKIQKSLIWAIIET